MQVQEIFWDYAYETSPGSAFRCQCGSEKCRWKVDYEESEDDEDEIEKENEENGEDSNS